MAFCSAPGQVSPSPFLPGYPQPWSSALLHVTISLPSWVSSALELSASPRHQLPSFLGVLSPGAKRFSTSPSPFLPGCPQPWSSALLHVTISLLSWVSSALELSTSAHHHLPSFLHGLSPGVEYKEFTDSHRIGKNLICDMKTAAHVFSCRTLSNVLCGEFSA